MRALTDNAADTVRGILLATLAYMVLTLGDVAAKWSLLSVGVAWVLLWRGLFGMATVLGVTSLRPDSGGWRRIRPVRWRLIALRGALSSFSTVTWYLSWRHLLLADTYALGFTAPLIMTLLAVPLLHERIRWRRLLSTVLGFAGVLVMLRPGGDLWTPAVLLLMVGIVAMAVTRIMTRQLSVTETPECQAFWLMVSHAVTGALTLGWLPGGGVTTPAIWLALGFLGVSSGLAHCVFTRAYGLAPVSALAPYEYTMLIWGGLAGWAAFGEVPSWSTLGGAAIVAGAGLYNLHRERLRRVGRGDGHPGLGLWSLVGCIGRAVVRRHHAGTTRGQREPGGHSAVAGHQPARPVARPYADCAMRMRDNSSVLSMSAPLRPAIPDGSPAVAFMASAVPRAGEKAATQEPVEAAAGCAVEAGRAADAGSTADTGSATDAGSAAVGAGADLAVLSLPDASSASSA
jgi:drug/metabolite transporter (DMT)-like permease